MPTLFIRLKPEEKRFKREFVKKGLVSPLTLWWKCIQADNKGAKILRKLAYLSPWFKD